VTFVHRPEKNTAKMAAPLRLWATILTRKFRIKTPSIKYAFAIIAAGEEYNFKAKKLQKNHCKITKPPSGARYGSGTLC
jgi:hypothetical protein